VKRTTIRRQTLSGSKVKFNAGIVKSLLSRDKKSTRHCFSAQAGNKTSGSKC